MESERQALRRVRRACEANDPRATRDALLAWGRVRWPENPPLRLESVGQRLGAPGMLVSQRLDRHLYAAGDERWDGLGTWRELSLLLQPSAVGSRRTRPQGSLPGLYPQQT